MEVLVKAQGHDIPISVDPGESVHATKALLGEKLGCPPANLQLLLHGTTLGDEASLSSCNVGNGETLQLVMGGARTGDASAAADGQNSELAVSTTMGDDP